MEENVSGCFFLNTVYLGLLTVLLTILIILQKTTTTK